MRRVKPLVETASQRSFDRNWLLVDLFTKEVLVTALVELFDIPGDVEDTFLGRCRIELKGAVPIGLEHCHFAIVEWHHLLGVANHCGDVGADQHFLFADADDDWRTVAGNHDSVGLRGVDHTHAVCSLNHSKGQTKCIFEVVTFVAVTCH